jgi:alpha-tubulin suppressor-like RCC1 family protein
MRSLSHIIGAFLWIGLLVITFLVPKSGIQMAQSPYTAVAAAWNHTCALTQAGEVYCWGRNDYGQLGIAALAELTIPTMVSSLPGTAVALDSGGQRTCAVDVQGRVWCWGINEYDRLGAGMLGSIVTPFEVVGLQMKATTVAVGDFHTCALLAMGEVQCWGANSFGQLGDGSLDDSAEPVFAVGFSGAPGAETAIAIEAGSASTCVLTASRKVQCWGSNRKGELGNGTTADHRTPLDVVSPTGEGFLERVDAIASGASHTCALTDIGEVYCWGRNDRGQLGIARTTSRSIPVRVSRLTTPVKALAAGSAHTCALTRQGEVWCWGLNKDGQLGVGSTNDYTAPAKIVNPSNITAIAAGGWHTCALTEGGSLLCWGWNQQGQLGDGSITDRLRPVHVLVALPASISPAPAAPNSVTASPITRQIWSTDTPRPDLATPTPTATQPLSPISSFTDTSAVTVETVGPTGGQAQVLSPWVFACLMGLIILGLAGFTFAALRRRENNL